MFTDLNVWGGLNSDEVSFVYLTYSDLVPILTFSAIASSKEKHVGTHRNPHTNLVCCASIRVNRHGAKGFYQAIFVLVVNTLKYDS